MLMKNKVDKNADKILKKAFKFITDPKNTSEDKFKVLTQVIKALVLQSTNFKKRDEKWLKKN